MNEPIEHIFIDGQGVARTRNKRVKVKMIATKHLRADETVADVAAHYGITLADVHAALAYYYDNKEEFDEMDNEAEELLKKRGINAEEHLARMRARLREKQGETDTGE